MKKTLHFSSAFLLLFLFLTCELRAQIDEMALKTQHSGINEYSIQEADTDSLIQAITELEIKMQLDKSLVKDFVKQQVKKVNGEIGLTSQVGLIHDFYGRDSSNIQLRNSVTGASSYKMKYLDANLSFGVMDLKNDFGPSNYFSLNFTPSAPTNPGIKMNRPDLPDLDGVRINTIDSLKSLIDNKKANLDAEKRKTYLQLQELNKIEGSIEEHLPSNVGQDSLVKIQQKKVALEKKFELANEVLEKLMLAEQKLNKLKGFSVDKEVGFDKETKKLEGSLLKKFSSINIGRNSSMGIGHNKSALPMNGLSFGLDFDKYYFEHSTGILQPLVLDYNDPLMGANSGVNSQNFLSSLRPTNNSLVSSTLIGFGSRKANSIFYKSSLIKDFKNKNSLLVNQSGIKKNFKKLRGLNMESEIGHVEDSQNDTSRIQDGLFATLNINYSVTKTKSKLGLEVKSVNKAAGLAMAGNAVSDFRSLGISFDQSILRRLRFSFQSELAELGKSDSKENRTNSVNNNFGLNAKLLDGLLLNATYSTGRFERGLLSVESNQVQSASLNGIYVYEIMETKLSSQVTIAQSEIFNFQDVLTHNMFNVVQNIEFNEGDFSLSVVDQRMYRSNVELMNSIIYSTSYSREYKNISVLARLDFSKVRSDNTRDIGGKIKIESELKHGLVLDFNVERHVRGSYMSTLFAKRFQVTPYEVSLGIKKLF